MNDKLSISGEVSQKSSKIHSSSIENQKKNINATDQEFQGEEFCGYDVTNLLQIDCNSQEPNMESMNNLEQTGNSELAAQDSLHNVANSSAVKDLGVPKFLVNKWLNIQNAKSKFADLNCQFDNKDDVSVYSETTQSVLSSKIMPRFLYQK